MLFLLSPAKSLDYDTPAHVATHTRSCRTDRHPAPEDTG
jgi:cytoplasmic iron level regulating protein YaaA (DUF328/UPF0246 family)